MAKLTPEEEERLKALKLKYEVSLVIADMTVPKSENMTEGRWLFLLFQKSNNKVAES